MGWVESKSVRLYLPAFAEEFVGCEAGKGVEPLCEVVGGNEIAEVRLWLVVAVVVTLNACFSPIFRPGDKRA